MATSAIGRSLPPTPTVNNALTPNWRQDDVNHNRSSSSTDYYHPLTTQSLRQPHRFINNRTQKFSSDQNKINLSKNVPTVGRSQSHVSAHSAGKYKDKLAVDRPRCSCDASASMTTTNESPTQFTLVLMGAPMVGKSTLVNQFLWEIFLKDYRPTVEEFNWIEYGTNDNNDVKRSRYSSSNFSSSSSIESNDSNLSDKYNNFNNRRSSLLLQIIDSAGSRDFLAMRHLYYRIGDAFMIVYSVNDPLSFAEALLMIREIQSRNSKKAPILLVANKADLESSENSADSKSRPEIISSLPNPQNIEFMKLSAKNLNQVKQAFNRLIDELAQKRDGCLQRYQLQKRRQSMPSRRTANELGIDDEVLKRLVRLQHNSNTRHANCTIS